MTEHLPPVVQRLTPWWVEIAALAALLAIALGLPGLNLAGAGFLLFLAPGWQVARLLGLRHKRGYALAWIALGLSLALAPVVVYWTGIVLGFHPLSTAAAMAGVVLLAGALARLRPASQPAPVDGLPWQERRSRWLAGLLLAALAVMVAVPYIQVTLRGALYPTEINDWAKHYTVVWLLEQSGIPPRNLLYPPQREEPFVYYYFFHIVVATLRLWSGQALGMVSAFVIVTLLAVMDLAVLLGLLVQRLFRQERAALWSLVFVTIATSFDFLSILPQTMEILLAQGWTLRAFVGLSPVFNCQDRLVSLYSAYLWAPHHVAAGLVFLLLALLLSLLGQTRRLAALLPLLLVALAGYSVYVAVPVFAALAIYALLDVAARGRSVPGRRGRAIATALAGWAGVAGAFALLSLPYLRDLLVVTSAESAGLTLYIARNGRTWYTGGVALHLLGDHRITRLLDAPAHYLLHLGPALILGAAGWLLYRPEAHRQRTGSPATETHTSQRDGSHRTSPERLAARFLALGGGAALLLTLFVASSGSLTGVTCNDFRMRGALPLQIALACFAGLAMSTSAPRSTGPRRDAMTGNSRWRRLLYTLALLLVLAAGLNTARAFAGWGLSRFVQQSAVSPQALAALRFVRDQTPPEAIIQGAGNRYPRDRDLHLYADRVSRLEIGSFPLLHVSSDAFYSDGYLVYQAFVTPDAQESWRLWRELGVDYIFVGPEERTLYRQESDLGQLDDARYFEPVYNASPYHIYRVRPNPLP